MKNLYDRLIENSESDMYPMHMPGHKRNSNVLPERDRLLSEIYRIDITEIDGFDNLHAAETLIKTAENEAAALWHADETHFLINGSTVGILAAVSTVAKRGDTLIIGRNCHKSVFNAAYINKLKLEYVYPEIIDEFDLAGEISKQSISNTVSDAERNNKKIAAVLITSPTYDGIISDIKSISEMLHKKGIPLIVDEAHGAHFGLTEGFPKSAVSCGADIVIQSAHKTLPAPTQTALIHINGQLVDINNVRRYLGIYQSSSPSYILMAGLQEAVGYMKKYGEEALKVLIDRRKLIKDELKGLDHIKICDISEPGKLVISVKNTKLTGSELAEMLRKDYHIEVEMAAETYALCILTVADTDEGISRLINAIKKIDSRICAANNQSLDIKNIYGIKPVKKYEYYEAYDMKGSETPLKDAEGMASSDFLYLYPPGIPIVVPGEIISANIINKLITLMDKGYKVSGITDNKVKIIWGN